MSSLVHIRKRLRYRVEERHYASSHPARTTETSQHTARYARDTAPETSPRAKVDVKCTMRTIIVRGHIAYLFFTTVNKGGLRIIQTKKLMLILRFVAHRVPVIDYCGIPSRAFS